MGGGLRATPGGTPDGAPSVLRQCPAGRAASEAPVEPLERPCVSSVAMASPPVPPEPPRHAAFAGYRFALDSGELTDPQGVVRPLARQPAQLLRLLLERAGEVVSREEIRRALWPAVTVDFDQGMVFCVRQIRSALAEPPGSLSLVETLPKRGYRLRAAVAWSAGRGAFRPTEGRASAVAVDEDPGAGATADRPDEGGGGLEEDARLSTWTPATLAAAPGGEAAAGGAGSAVGDTVAGQSVARAGGEPAAVTLPSDLEWSGRRGARWPAGWRRRWFAALGAGLVLVVVSIFLLLVGAPRQRAPVGGPGNFEDRAENRAADPAADPVRVAIMPFALDGPLPGTPLAPDEDPRRVAAELLATLPGRLAGRAGVIGPTTTEAYAGRPDPVAVLAAERAVTYVVNGRLLATSEGPRLLVEVIRTSDGVHVWVRRWALDAPAEAIAADVAEGLLAELGTGRR
jgi:DNA-binding winged helix-turn-helix (wHTH) protein